MAVFQQERHVELVTGANEQFVITSLMVSATIPDQLPHLNVFVVTIVDPDDPKQDTLARVARIADLTTIPIGRTAGIITPGPTGPEYLAASSTNFFDTLETGNDAAVAFKDRVNQLIEDWITFRTEFNAPDPTPAQYILPVVDPSQKAALIEAYALAKQDAYQKQLIKTEADAELTRTQADYTYKQSLLPDLDTAVASAGVNENEMLAVISSFSSLLTSSNIFYSANTGGVGAAAFLTAIQLATTAQTTQSGYPADTAALTALINNYRTLRQTDAATSSTNLTTAQSDQITKTQQLTSAQVLETAALNAVLAICPDFDATTIPFVPG
jgi:hypothetical protein